MADSDIVRCVACGTTVPIADVPSTCPQCGGILDVECTSSGDGPIETAPGGLWTWARFLPRCSRANRISLGEANTPLLQCDRIAAASGIAELWIKNDSIMPTGSFKDRAIALATSLAREYGRRGLVLSSSGNAGASGAAYAARAGLPIVVLVPRTAPEAKLRQIAITGAKLVTVDGTTSDCCQIAQRLAHEQGWVNLTTTYHNPYGVDAYATIAYETAHLDADVVLLPISCGALLAGMMKGYAKLKATGSLARVPRPVAVQSMACAPIARAFDEDSRVRPWAHQDTVASALNDTLAGYERDGDYTLSWVRRYDGCAVAVGDAAIAASVRELASLEGIVVEPSAAVPIAALRVLKERGFISPDERILAVATGHGLKDLSCAPTDAHSRPIRPDDVSALRGIVADARAAD